MQIILNQFVQRGSAPDNFDYHQYGYWSIAPDKAAYCVFTQFRERENAIKFISVRTKTQ